MWFRDNLAMMITAVIYIIIYDSVCKVKRLNKVLLT